MQFLPETEQGDLSATLLESCGRFLRLRVSIDEAEPSGEGFRVIAENALGEPLLVSGSTSVNSI